MAESQRPSRQDLVVPPRGSNFSIVLGALVCAGAGFGLVWSLGIGRSSGDYTLPFPTHATMPDGSLPGSAVAGVDAAPPPVAEGLAPRTFADEPVAGAPRRFPAVDAADALPAPRQPGWPQAPAAAAPPATADERYPTRPAALEVPDDVKPLEPGLPPDQPGAAPSRFGPATSSALRPTSFAATEEERFSRFAATPAAAGEPPADTADVPPSDPAGVPPAAFAGDPGSADTTSAAMPAATADAPADGEPPLLAAETAATGDDPPAQPFAADAADAAAADAPADPPAAPSAGGYPVRGPVDQGPADRGPTSTDIPPPAAPPQVAAPQAFPPPTAAPRAAPLTVAGPSPTASPVVPVGSAGASAFAGAPPMGPPPVPRPAAPRGDDFPPAPAAAAGLGAGAAAMGQGRPGGPQLEGAQTPQLVVEKRGPREIQVGKAVRYEILVRNVGKAVAQDVTLRDSVPYGTTLVATTPPASPAGGPAELLWPLGPLAPGAETRVSMEVMPQIEGDVGSVASVSFRAEASLRSRATKPDLRLEMTETKPVRIGGDVPLSLKVSNPGTGVATGVVLEGILPDGVSHRAGRELEFDVGQLRPGESRSIDLVLSTTGPGVHQARFTARADGRLEVEQAARIEITAPTLELKAEMPSRRYLQRPATCVLTMVNAGTAPARSVELAAQLPAGLKFVRANHAGWYDERTHRVLWNLEELPPGEVGAVELVVMPVDLGPQKIVAAARSTDGPADQAAHTVEVEGLAALFFEVSDSEDPIEVGGLTEYIVRVRNQGTKAAAGVRVTATMLGEMEPVDAKGPSAHHVENLSFVFDPLARLSPAEEAVYRIRVRGRRAGDQRVQVQVTSDDHPAPTTKEEVTRVYADQ